MLIILLKYIKITFYIQVILLMYEILNHQIQ